MCVTCIQEGDLPVHCAAYNGKLDVVKCLLDVQSDTISVKNNVSWTISTIDSPYSTALFLVMRITVQALCLLLGNITSSIPTRSDFSRLPYGNLLVHFGRCSIGKQWRFFESRAWLFDSGLTPLRDLKVLGLGALVLMAIHSSLITVLPWLGWVRPRGTSGSAWRNIQGSAN